MVYTPLCVEVLPSFRLRKSASISDIQPGYALLVAVDYPGGFVQPLRRTAVLHANGSYVDAGGQNYNHHAKGVHYNEIVIVVNKRTTRLGDFATCFDVRFVDLERGLMGPLRTLEIDEAVLPEYNQRRLLVDAGTYLFHRHRIVTGARFILHAIAHGYQAAITARYNHCAFTLSVSPTGHALDPAASRTVRLCYSFTQATWTPLSATGVPLPPPLARDTVTDEKRDALAAEMRRAREHSACPSTLDDEARLQWMFDAPRQRFEPVLDGMRAIPSLKQLVLETLLERWPELDTRSRKSVNAALAALSGHDSASSADDQQERPRKRARYE